MHRGLLDVHGDRDGEVVPLEWTTVRTRIAGLPYMVSMCRRVN